MIVSDMNGGEAVVTERGRIGGGARVSKSDRCRNGGRDRN
jgi:hypothetical protein